MREKPANLRATTAQWQAIIEDGKNILVSASAGSGKTMVLVQRIIEKIKAGQALENLLVVTFTEAAAKEMKERIQKALEKEVNTTSDQALKHHYIEQLQKMGKANISTIHAFCLTVIRRFFYVTNLDPVFSLMSDGVEELLLREKVWRHLQDQLLIQDPSFSHLSEFYSNDRNDNGITTIVYRLYDFARANADPQAWLRSLPALYDQGDSWEESVLVQTYIHPQLEALLIDAQKTAQSLVAEAALYQLDHRYESLLQREKELIDRITERLLAFDYHAIYATLATLEFEQWPRIKKQEKEAGQQTMIEQLKEKRTALKAVLEQLTATYFWTSPSQQLEHLNQLQPIIAQLSQTVMQFYTAMQVEKQRLNKVDFSDLEHMTLEILLATDDEGNAVAANFYQQQFNEVLVDEYQDVNRVQEAILQLVTRHAPRTENMFMVGDVKQSIYAFRLADPSLFLTKYESYGQQQGGNRILLAENFRSRSEVLNFTNIVFKQLMNKSLGNMNYDQAAELIVGNQSYTEQFDKAPELLVVESKEADDESHDSDELNETFETTIEAEITLTAIKIKELLATKFLIMDATTGENRPLKWSDIVLLTPTKSHNMLIGELFEQFEIPVILQKTDQYFKRTEITTILAALRIVDNPLQDIPLVAVLRSGMVGLNEVELAFIRQNRQKMSFYQALKEYSLNGLVEGTQYFDHSKQDQLLQKVQHFLTLLEKWRMLANKISVAQLIWIIYQDTHFLEYVQGQQNGTQRLMNLHALYERAHQFEQSSFKGLHRFVLFIEQMQKQQKDLAEPSALAEGEDAVRVMTIHASKGLEFPVVFLLNSAKKFNLQTTTEHYIFSDKLGIGTRYFDLTDRIYYPSLAHLAIQQEQLRRELSEEMRKLYVALTRARDKLFIVGVCKNQQQFKANWEKLQYEKEWVLPEVERLANKGYLHWIALALARATHVEGDQYIIFGRTFQVKLQFYSHQTIRELIPQALIKNVSEQEASLERLWVPYNQAQNATSSLERLTHSYDFEAETTTANYQSVSEIKRIFNDPSIKTLEPLHQPHVYLSPQLAKPKFLSEQHNVSATEKGSALHLLMQHIPLNDAITSLTIKELIQTMIQENKFSSEVAATIAIDDVLRFFQSDFGQWLVEHASTVKREQAFSYILPAGDVFSAIKNKNDLLLVHGIVDGYVELEHGLVIYDFKTDYLRDNDESIQRTVEQYRGQLNVYARALGKSVGKPVIRKVLCLMSIGKNISI